MTEEKKQKPIKRSEFGTQLNKWLLFVLVGLLLIVQPWLTVVSWAGWIVLVFAGLMGCAAIMRLVNAKKMQKQLVAEFACGDAVFAHGLRVEGALYDFATVGVQVDEVTFDGEKLHVRYSFWARRGGRAVETLSIPVAPDEADKARAALEHILKLKEN